MNSERQDEPSNPEEVYQSRQLERIAERWNAKAAGWDRDLQDLNCHLNEDDAYLRFLELLSREVCGRQAFCREHGVIDVGCATGLVLASIVRNFAWGLGVDISPEMIRVAKAKAIPNTRFCVGDCFALSGYPKAGVVLSRGVLLSHYGPQHAEPFLASLRSALAPGGFVLCDFLSASGKDKFEHVATNKAHFEPSQICEAALSAGFQSARTLSEPERRVHVLLAE